MDEIDKKILELLQRNATLPLTELSKKVGISSTPCWNRIKKMEEDGIIESKATIINKDKINLSIVIFLSISISSHTEEWLDKFNKVIMKYDQIIEVDRLTGSNMDYMLKIVAPSIKQYDELQQKLIKELNFNKMSSSISLKQLKKTNILPLKFL